MRDRQRLSVDGIGGVFLNSNDPRRLAGWYRRVLEIPLQPMSGDVYYHVFQSRSLAHPKKKVGAVLAIFPTKANLGRTRNQVIVNLRVRDLEALAARVRKRRVSIDPVVAGEDGEGIGKFTHLSDPEGNRIELWEPSHGV